MLEFLSSYGNSRWCVLASILIEGGAAGVKRRESLFDDGRSSVGPGPSAVSDFGRTGRAARATGAARRSVARVLRGAPYPALIVTTEYWVTVSGTLTVVPVTVYGTGLGDGSAPSGLATVTAVTLAPAGRA